jgi:hypothetical protein
MPGIERDIAFSQLAVKGLKHNSNAVLLPKKIPALLKVREKNGAGLLKWGWGWW